MTSDHALPSSFRDPSGFLFLDQGTLYRQVNRIYQSDYDQLMNSGLYEKLVSEKMLVAHEEVDISLARGEDAYRILHPDLLPFISYPYEWCFSQLKDAALLTLRIQQEAMQHGMSLKDATAYNVQFVDGKPIFIDTLSFHRLPENRPWLAYRQFCQHFLAPLALMAKTDVRLNELMRVNMDGIPLDMASSMLPGSSRFSFPLLTHIHLHARSQRKHEKSTAPAREGKLSLRALQGILDNLEGAIKGLKWKMGPTEWGDYYQQTNYSDNAMEAKKKQVESFLGKIEPKDVWDLGANNGEFSRLASKQGIHTVSFDIDPVAVERNYLQCREEGGPLLPLQQDLTNPSPSIGFAHRERMSLQERSPKDTVLALALIHHLSISNNVPLEKTAVFFASLCEWLIIEFVPKSDSQVQRLLSTREDIFPDYTQDGFERAFATTFELVEQVPIVPSQRILYRMRARS